jgi:hypothetical protein
VPPTTPAEVLTRLGAYGWGLLFQDEEDGSRHWWVTDSDGETILQSGKSAPDEDWQDALLQSVMNLYPPSEEALMFEAFTSYPFGFSSAARR